MEILDWDDIYAQLYAYTDHLLKAKKWFRKDGADSYLKGKQVHDYISEAIEKHLRHPGKFDSTSNRSLVNYLKLHIIRTLVGNDATSSENRTTDDIFATLKNDVGSDDTQSSLDVLLPFANAFFDQEIDYQEIVSYVKSELSTDEICGKIFEGICCGLKRRESIEEYNLTETQFDNGMKRLNTVLRKTAIKYDLTKLR